MKIIQSTEKINFTKFDTVLVTVDVHQHLSCDNEKVAAALDGLKKDELFKDKAGEVYGLRMYTETPKNIVFLHIGEPAKLSYQTVEEYFAKAAKEAGKLGGKNFAAILPDYLSEGLAVKACEAMLLSSYTFQKYQTKNPAPKKDKDVTIAYFKDISAALVETEKLVKATMFARDLANEPANVLTPTTYAQTVVKAGKDYGFKVEVYGPDKVKELGMHAYYAVGMGSDEPLQLIVMKYMNNPKSKEITGLIGKGLTYDSGGYAIKPAGGMVTMKVDMAGSAGVVGAMCAIADVGLKANVIGVVAACENMVSGHAYRNGDILPTMAGKYIEVVNTDAEGRLTLIDAITYAIREQKVTSIIDVATLTGAAVSTFGREMAAVLCSDEKLMAQINKAAAVSNDRIWEMPCDENLGKQNESKIADIRNAGASFGGTITAGLFVREFTEGLPWAHLDMAGPSATDEDRPICVKGGTGWGTRLMYHLVKEINQ